MMVLQIHFDDYDNGLEEDDVENYNDYYDEDDDYESEDFYEDDDIDWCD